MAICTSYCAHGGRCIKSAGHPEDTHDSRNCTWTSAQGLTREEADEILTTQPGGIEFLATDQMIADFIEKLLGS